MTQMHIIELHWKFKQLIILTLDKNLVISRTLIFNIESVYNLYDKVTQILQARRVRAKITGKLLILCNFDLYHSICTKLLYKILFTKSNNIHWFSFYSTKCPARFNYQNAKSLDFSGLRYQGDYIAMGKILRNVVFFLKSLGFFLKKGFFTQIC